MDLGGYILQWPWKYLSQLLNGGVKTCFSGGERKREMR